MVAAPPPFCFTWFSSLPLGARFVFFVRCAPPLSLAFAGFRPRVPWALARCVFFFSPPAPLLSVRSRLVCVSRLVVGCALVVAASPPLCLAVFVAASRCSGFFFFFSFPFVVRPRHLWFLLVSGPGCPGPWRCVVSFFSLASRFSARCSLFPLLCLPPSSVLLPGVCCPPLPFSVSRFSPLPLGAGFFFPLCAPVVSGFFWFPAPGALGIGTV